MIVMAAGVDGFMIPLTQEIRNPETGQYSIELVLGRSVRKIIICLYHVTTHLVSRDWNLVYTDYR